MKHYKQGRIMQQIENSSKAALSAPRFALNENVARKSLLKSGVIC